MRIWNFTDHLKAGGIVAAVLLVCVCHAVTNEVSEKVLFDIDFQDHPLSRWDSRYGGVPIINWGFAHVVENPADPGNRYLEHRPGFTAHGGTGDVNWVGQGLNRKIPRLEPGQELRLNFDCRLFFRNTRTGMNLLECLVTKPESSARDEFPVKIGHWGGTFYRNRRLGFKLMQTPRIAGRASPDGYLGIALKPVSYWAADLHIDLNDIGVHHLGRDDADTESDALNVTYTVSRYDRAPFVINSVMVSNTVTAAVWQGYSTSRKAETMLDDGLFIGFGSDSDLSGDEGFEMDNIRCSVGKGFQTLEKFKAQKKRGAVGQEENVVYETAIQTVSSEGPLEQEPPFLLSIPGKLKEIAARKAEIKSEIKTLPVVQESLQLNAYGYHGGYLPALDKLPEEPRWMLDIEFQSGARVEEVVLVPAIDRRFDDSRGYGFPKRFRVLQVFHDGSSRIAREWMTEDCPDPGRMPMVIKMPDPRSNRFRVEVFRGSREGQKEVFALDEFMGVVRQEIFRSVNVEAKTVYEARPYWGKGYLTDHKTSLGLPTARRTSGIASGTSEDFSVAFDRPPKKPIVLEIDLGQNRRLGWVTLFPAKSPEGILIPGYGFPGKINMEMVPELQNGKRGKTIELETAWEGGNPGNNVVRLEGRSEAGRWIRFIIDKLPRHYGANTFALGEINVYRSGEVFPIQQVNFEGFPPGTEENAALLWDGKAGGQPIMFLFDWLKQLEQKHKLTKELSRLSMNERLFQARWNGFLRSVFIVILVIVVLGAVLVALGAIVLRRRHAKQLRQQITEDLHDEIGSKVGAINLYASLVRKTASDPRAIESNRRIEVIAKEMQQSLRDVLWFTNNNTDTLRDVVQKLAEIAEAMVPPSILKLDRSPSYEIPESTISIQVKRNVLLIFREAVHNATQHSGATKIEVRIRWSKPGLVVTVWDNGAGFIFEDLSLNGKDKRRHLGLESMQRRAMQIKGELTIESSPGEGTELKLKLKI
ncbi:sensor histidine kinase [Pontiella agarivorans]|uniref:ATP-binding protein n=1 Tax=Pontiella agarivorans TaxID=3038953 RepID=A0ABU5MS99_9BACT|nr:ATP-binding protein [Pontiella agarivorans]MDZ8117080.1 ATP-binding protein [Pontiella agarivorans]